MSAVRVLFMHGLESGPGGTKVRALREAGFEVHAADMGMSRWRLDRPNSVARNLLRSPEAWLATAGGLWGLASGVRRRSVSRAAASVALPAGWIALRRRALLASALGRSLDACVAIQRDALSTFRPHVVVGSSWGGAVAAELLLEGAWRGPTVLLAPALRKARAGARRPVGEAERRLRAISAEVPIVIFHDPTDDTVPHLDSVRLAAGSSIELHSVDAGGHRLLGLLERGELARCVRALVE